MTRNVAAYRSTDALMQLYPYESWMARGACLGADAELFFSVEPDDTAAAQSICGGCPVQYQCGAYAVNHRIRSGIWGGLTEGQRRRIWKRKGAA